MTKLNDLYDVYKLNPDEVNSENLATELLEYCTACTRKWYSKRYPQYNDAVGETVAQVWESIRTGIFDNKLSSIKTWTTTVLKTRCIDLTRQNIDLVPLDEASTIIDNKEHWREEKIDLYRTIPTLTERQQEVIGLTLEGYTQEEIAEQLHLTQQTVEEHYKVSVKNLQKKLV